MQETPSTTEPFHQWTRMETDTIIGFSAPDSPDRVIASKDASSSVTLVRHQQTVFVDGIETAVDVSSVQLRAPPEPAVRKTLDELGTPPELVGLAVIQRDDEDIVDVIVCDGRELDDQTIDDLKTALQESSPAHGDVSDSARFELTPSDDVDVDVSLDVHPKLQSDVIYHD